MYFPRGFSNRTVPTTPCSAVELISSTFTNLHAGPGPFRVPEVTGSLAALPSDGRVTWPRTITSSSGSSFTYTIIYQYVHITYLISSHLNRTGQQNRSTSVYASDIKLPLQAIYKLFKPGLSLIHKENV